MTGPDSPGESGPSPSDAARLGVFDVPVEFFVTIVLTVGHMCSLCECKPKPTALTARSPMHQRSSESSVRVAVGTSGTVVTGHGRSPGRNSCIHTRAHVRGWHWLAVRLFGRNVRKSASGSHAWTCERVSGASTRDWVWVSRLRGQGLRRTLKPDSEERGLEAGHPGPHAKGLTAYTPNSKLSFSTTTGGRQ